MIDSVKIRSFQSLHNVDLELSKFNVFVGPSSSGKSAVLRAIRACVENGLHSDNISRGSKSSSITLTVEGKSVTIERESNGSSVYKIAESGSEESRYSKLNRKVPSQVTKALGLAPSGEDVGSIHFAGQFDAPYLLTDGASSVARVLGELTNVSKVFAAVAEASRRAKNSSAKSNLRKKDEQQIVAQLSGLKNIGEVAKKTSQAELLMTEADTLAAMIARRKAVISTAQQAVEAFEALREIPSPPDCSDVVASQEKLKRYKYLLRTVVMQDKLIADTLLNVDKTSTDITSAEEELHALLQKSGKCPTCNQTI